MRRDNEHPLGPDMAAKLIARTGFRQHQRLHRRLRPILINGQALADIQVV